MPVKARLLPAAGPAEHFSFLKPYEGYDRDVLTKYAAWLVEFGKAEKMPVIDAHKAVADALAEGRKADPKFAFSGDGIHPNAAGHYLVFRALLDALDLPADATTEVAVKGGVGAWTARPPFPMPKALPAGAKPVRELVKLRRPPGTSSTCSRGTRRSARSRGSN